MSKIKNGGLDQYGAGPFEQQQFGTAGIEGVKQVTPFLKWMKLGATLHTVRYVRHFFRLVVEQLGPPGPDDPVQYKLNISM